MGLINNEQSRTEYKELKQQLKFEVDMQFKLLKQEKLQRLQKIGYVRPRTRLQQMYAEDYMTDKQFANILGLGQIIKKHPELTNEDLYKFILNYKVTLTFLNHFLKVVPDAIGIIRNDGENKAVFKYVRILEEKKIRRSKENKL